MKVGDFVVNEKGKLMVVFEVYDDMGPNIEGYGMRPATFWEKVKFKLARLGAKK